MSGMRHLLYLPDSMRWDPATPVDTKVFKLWWVSFHFNLKHYSINNVYWHPVYQLLFITNDEMLISNICQYFCWKKCEKLLQCKSYSHFFNKNISSLIFFNKNYQCVCLQICKTLTSWPLEKLVKLTMLWTTVPWYKLKHKMVHISLQTTGLFNDLKCNSRI